MIAASVGVDIEPQAFTPIRRGLLRTGGPPRQFRRTSAGA
jgi:hypothetical protein